MMEHSEGEGEDKVEVEVKCRLPIWDEAQFDDFLTTDLPRDYAILEKCNDDLWSSQICQ